MRIIKICFFFFSFSMLAQNIEMTSLQGSSFQSKVVKKAKGINSFSADFIQIKHMKMMNESPRSKGRVYYKSPNLLKWEYSAPYDYQVLFKNSKLFILEDGELSEIDLSGNKVFEKMGDLVAGSMNGKILEANKDFTIEYFRKKGIVLAKIIPNEKKLSNMFSEIWLSFNEDQLINSVKLVDPSGDYTEIFMKNIQINQSIAPSVFEN